MLYTKQQLQEMYLKYAEKQIAQADNFRKQYIPISMRPQGETNTIISFLGGKRFIDSLE